MDETSAYYKYIDMVRLIAHRLYSRNALYGTDDLIQVGSISIINCCRKFDPSRNAKMSTLVYLAAKRDMIGFIIKNDKKKKESELDDKIEKELIFNYIDDIDEYFPYLNEDDKKIINFIKDGYNREDISKKINTTTFKMKKKIESIFKRIEISNEEKNTVSN